MSDELVNNLYISIDKAKKDKLFYVVANILIINKKNNKILLLKRAEREKVFPGKWAFPGGKLEHGDLMDLMKNIKPVADDLPTVENIFGILAAREAKEECGIYVSVDQTKIIGDKVFIRPDGVPVVLAILATVYKSGDVVLEEGGFTEFSWVSLEEMTSYDFIIGMDKEASVAFNTV